MRGGRRRRDFCAPVLVGPFEVGRHRPGDRTLPGLPLAYPRASIVIVMTRAGRSIECANCGNKEHLNFVKDGMFECPSCHTHTTVGLVAATGCEIVACGVAAVGRCADCNAAFCGSHGQDSLCRTCREGKVRHCHCGMPTEMRCERCGDPFCPRHGHPAGFEWNPTLYVHVATSKALCRPCYRADGRKTRQQSEGDRQVPHQFVAAMANAGNPGSVVMPIVGERNPNCGRSICVWEIGRDTHTDEYSVPNTTIYYFGDDGRHYRQAKIHKKSILGRLTFVDAVEFTTHAPVPREADVLRSIAKAHNVKLKPTTKAVAER